MDIFSIFSDWRLWIMFLMMSVMSYILAQYYMRKVFVRMAYHRRGSTVDILQCFEKEDRVIFKTNPDPITRKKEEINITKKGRPEIQVSGLKTFKLWHAVEGYGSTIDIREVAEMNPRRSGSPSSTSFSVMGTAFDLMQRTAGKTKGDWMMIAALCCVTFITGLGWGLYF